MDRNEVYFEFAEDFSESFDKRKVDYMSKKVN